MKKKTKQNQEFTSRVPELTSLLCSSGSSFQTLTRADHRCSKCLIVSQQQRVPWYQEEVQLGAVLQ